MKQFCNDLYPFLPGSGNGLSDCLIEASKKKSEFCAKVNGKEKTFTNKDVYGCHLKFGKDDIDDKSSYHGHCKSGKLLLLLTGDD